MNSPSKNTSAPTLKNNYLVSLGAGSCFTLAVFLALPLTGLVQSPGGPKLPDIENTVIRPPIAEEIPTVVEPDPDPDKPKLDKDNPPTPFLNPLDIPKFTSVDGVYSWGPINIPTHNIDDDLIDYKDLSRKPTAIAQPSPVYPTTLLRDKVEGDVVVEFIVRPDGSVDRPTVISSSHPGFNEPAVNAVRRWRFNPGEKDNRAVATRIQVRIPFRTGR